MPAAAARAEDGLPIGLAHGVRLRRGVAQGERISCGDVDLDPTDPVIKLRETLPSAR
jgi:predicted homoserine dehydrogenase-like protein